jgi:hypothetical protein
MSKIAHFFCISGRSSGPFVDPIPEGARKQAATVRGKLDTTAAWYRDRDRDRDSTPVTGLNWPRGWIEV